jgi:hypothetical protein
MKTALTLLTACTAVVVLYSRTPAASQQVHEPLRSNLSNGHLEQIGLGNELHDGARIYFRTNFTACAILRDHSQAHEFPDGSTASAILVEWNDGKQQWVNRKSMKHAWVQQ